MIMPDASTVPVPRSLSADSRPTTARPTTADLYPSDTIVSQATPPGASGVALVRISGPQSLDYIRQLCNQPLADHPRHAFLATLTTPDTDAVIDDALVTYFKGPASFTGEDVVEISTHGGYVTPRMVVQACLGLGARQANPGEFSLRAYLNGKLDLPSAEALHEQITSLSRRGQQAASDNLHGQLSRLLDGLRGQLRHLLATLEHELDFSEDEIESTTQAQIQATLEEALTSLKRLLETAPYGRILREGCRIVIAGAPNAGKSSLFNALSGRERAIVTDIPGTTRDSLENWIDMDGFPVCLIDTAGLHEGGDRLERLGIERSEEALEGADLVLFLDPDDPTIALNISPSASKTIIYVKSKSDLPGQGSAPEGVVSCSVVNEDGLDALHQALIEALQAYLPADDGPVVASDRQRAAIESALSSLTIARDGMLAGQPLDLLTGEVRLAVDQLAEIMGETTRQDVLQDIFAQFCVGK